MPLSLMRQSKSGMPVTTKSKKVISSNKSHLALVPPPKVLLNPEHSLDFKEKTRTLNQSSS